MSRPTYQDRVDAQEHLERALAAMEAGMPQWALEHLEPVLQHEPQNTTARIAKARAELAMNRPHAALVALDATGFHDATRGRSPEASMLRARALSQSDCRQLARTQLQQMVEQFPDDLRAHRMLAELWLQDGDQDKAIECLRHAQRLAPSDPINNRLLAQLLDDVEPQSSISLLEGEDATSLVRRARLCRRTGRDREAENLYAAVLEREDEDAELWLEAGMLASDLGADTLAIKRLEQALKLSNADDHRAGALLAKAHMHTGRFAAAGHVWWQAARQCPTDVTAWAGLLVCALCCDRVRIAKRARSDLERRTSKAERRLLLADLWQHAAMGKVIAQTIGDEADNEPQDQLTMLDQLLHRAADALVDHAQLHPQRADTHYHLATCRDALDDRDQAAEFVQRALAINPNYRNAQKLAQRLDPPDSLAA